MESSPSISKRLHTTRQWLWDGLAEAWRDLTDFSVRPVCTPSYRMGAVLGLLLVGLPWLCTFSPMLAVFAGAAGLLGLKFLHADLPDTRFKRTTRLKDRHAWLNDSDNLLSEVIQNATLSPAEAEALKQLRSTLQVFRDMYYRDWRMEEARSVSWLQHTLHRITFTAGRRCRDWRIQQTAQRLNELENLEKSLGAELHAYTKMHDGLVDSGLDLLKQRPAPKPGSTALHTAHAMMVKTDKQINWLKGRLQDVSKEKTQAQAYYNVICPKKPEGKEGQP